MVKPRVSTELLPADIWQRIIRLATEPPPFLFDTSLLSPFDEAHRHRATTTFGGNVRLKASFASVCKAWRAISLEYLVEDLRLCVKRIVPTASHGAIPDSLLVDTTAPLDHVKRLELRTNFLEDVSPFQYQHFIAMLRLFSNLNILKLSIFTPSLIGLVLEACGHSLQRLDLYSLEVPPRALHFLPQMAPILQYLSFNNTIIPPHDPFPSPPSFNALHTISYSNSNADLSKWNLPALQHLILGPGTAPHNLPKGVRMLSFHLGAPTISILDAHPRIELLSVQISYFAGESSRIAWNTVKGPFSSLRWVAITRVGETTHRYLTWSDAILLNLLMDRRRFPRIELIRCFGVNLRNSGPQTQQRADLNWWMGFQRMCQYYHVRLEDAVGEPLVDHSAENTLTPVSQA